MQLLDRFRRKKKRLKWFGPTDLRCPETQTVESHSFFRVERLCVRLRALRRRKGPLGIFFVLSFRINPVVLLSDHSLGIHYYVAKEKDLTFGGPPPYPGSSLVPSISPILDHARFYCVMLPGSRHFIFIL